MSSVTKEVISGASVPMVGTRIEVYWPKEKKYFPGIIEKITFSGRVRVAYNDGDSEMLLLSKEVWRQLRSNISKASKDSKDNKIRAAVNLHSQIDQISKNAYDMIQLTNTIRGKKRGSNISKELNEIEKCAKIFFPSKQ